MNDTKWNEIFKAFYYENELKENAMLIIWRTKDTETGFVSEWDGTWSHFGCEPREWNKIDYLQIRLNADNEKYVIDSLKKIHVPGTVEDGIVTVYGYRTDVEYI